MLRTPVRRNAPRQAVSKGASVPSPVGGWDAVSALADMPEDRAIVLENWFPSTGDIRVRRGHKIHGSGMGSGVVESLLPYNGLTTASSKLFAATDNKIYDVTFAGAAATAVSSLANNRWQHINFTTSGGKYLVICNGADSLRAFDGANWSTPSITGVSSSDCLNINGHKDRIWLILSNSTKAAYLPTVAVEAQQHF